MRMRIWLCAFVAMAWLYSVALPAAHAQSTAMRTVRLGKDGVVRWSENGDEVLLYGTNYSPMSAHDYWSVGASTKDRKAAIDQDLAHFARMGWTVIRLATWADWESSDKEGNLIQNDHVDLMDYLIAKERERGFYSLRGARARNGRKYRQRKTLPIRRRIPG